MWVYTFYETCMYLHRSLGICIPQPMDCDPEINDPIEDFKQLIGKKAFDVQMEQLAAAFSRLQIED